MRRGSGNSFTFAACSFQKQKRIIPPLWPSSFSPSRPLLYQPCIRAELREKLFRPVVPEGGSGAFNALRNTTAGDLIGLTLRGKYGGIRETHLCGVYATRVMSPPPPRLCLGSTREGTLNLRIRVAQRSSVRARSATCAPARARA